jgi:(p)ppGpp synthase/HD superfamily hydrolase
MKISETSVSKLSNKTEQIAGEIVEFKKIVAQNFEIKDAVKIYEALDLMLELHSDQKPYSDGKPYSSHPLYVASDLINKYEIRNKDLIIAGLLHDAIEDQKIKLQAKRLQRLKNEDAIGPSPEHDALLEIGDLFGPKVRKIVTSMTNPDFNKQISNLKSDDRKKFKNELYKKHVQDIIRDPEVFAVKFADFARNAFAISTLPDGEKKEHFKNKYGPVIKDVFLPAFESMPNDHPLFSQKGKIIKALKKLFKTQYQ